jgi:hypothetical protein
VIGAGARCVHDTSKDRPSGHHHEETGLSDLAWTLLRDTVVLQLSKNYCDKASRSLRLKVIHLTQIYHYMHHLAL